MVIWDVSSAHTSDWSILMRDKMGEKSANFDFNPSMVDFKVWHSISKGILDFEGKGISVKIRVMI